MTTQAETEFDAILEQYYRAWFRFYPEAAVEAGVAGFGAQLAPYSDDDIGALITLNQQLLDAIGELGDSLDEDRAIDRQLVCGAARIDVEALLARDWRFRDPTRYLPVNAIYQLLARPVADFADSLIARLTAIPEHLRGARQFLALQPEQIPALWLEAAVTEARSGAGFLRSLPNHPKVRREARRLRGLGEPLRGAVEALEAYGGFLHQDLRPVARGDFACGVEHFQRLLRYRHALDVELDDLYDFGARLFEQTHAELGEACHELTGNGDVAALTTKLQQDHPNADELINDYTQTMEQAYRFVTEHNLVSMPARERLQVIDTPVFMRHQIPFAAYMEPAPDDPAQRAWYFVTPPESEELLGEHNRASIMHTCVHEAWPGHHLQFVTANGTPAARTLPRLLNPSATLYEGWALYCEQLMHEQGFLDRPEQRFVLLKDRLWRAMRIMIDVAIHSRGLSVDEAAELMSHHLGFPRAQAMADLTWYSQSPSVPMGYATGWALINAVRRRQQDTQADFSLKGFHDQLLASGSIPLSLAIARGFGPQAWQQAASAVFDGAA